MDINTYLTIISIVVGVLIATVFKIVKNSTRTAKIICILAIIVGVAVSIYAIYNDDGGGPEPPTGNTDTTTQESEPEEPSSSEEVEKVRTKDVSLFSLETFYQNTEFILVNSDYQKANTGELFGDVMYYVYHWATYDEKTSVQKYKLDGKYISFSGTLFLPFESRSVTEPDYPSVFRIYADDKKIYEELNFLAEEDIVNFNVDISGCDILKIEMGGHWYAGDGSGAIPLVCLARPILVEELR